MYAGESRGGKFPSQAAISGGQVDCSDINYPPSSGDTTNFSFTWNPEQMYPEYISDFNVVICPSDSEPAELLNPATDELDAFRRCDTDVAGQGGRGWSVLDDSYVYLSYLLDKMDDDVRYNTNAEGYLAMTFGTSDCEYAPDAPVNAQVTAVIVDRIAASGAFCNGCTDKERNAIWLEDIDLDNGAGGMDWSQFTTPPGLPLGNGDSNTVFRLREGIERFLITDINNAGASSKAQSEIEVMWDQTSVFPSGFSHIPGGSNVLYVDGHVQFIKYPGTGPTSRGFAGVTGCVQD